MSQGTDDDDVLDASDSPAAPAIRAVASMFLISLLPEGHPLRAELTGQLTADLSVLTHDAAFRAAGGNGIAANEADVPGEINSAPPESC